MKYVITFVGILVATAFVPSAYAASCVDLTMNLQSGMRDGNSQGDIRNLQGFLSAQGYLDHPATGFYGTLTHKAVAAFQAKNGLESVGNTGPKTRALIKSMSCAVSTTPAPQEQAVSTAPDKQLPFRTVSFADWKAGWGSVTTAADGRLRLQPNASTTGAQAYSTYGKDWKDYRVSAHIFISNGDVTLYSQYIDDNNFLGCSFSGNWVAIQERVNGVSKTVASGRLENVLPGQYFLHDTWVSMRVDGNSVGCSTSGPADQLTYTLPSGHPPAHGGLAIETWSRGAAHLELKELIVEAQ